MTRTVIRFPGPMAKSDERHLLRTIQEEITQLTAQAGRVRHSTGPDHDPLPPAGAMAMVA